MMRRGQRSSRPIFCCLRARLITMHAMLLSGLFLVPSVPAADYTPFVSLWKGSLVTNAGMLSTSLLVRTVDLEKGTAATVYSQGTLSPFRPYETEAEGKFLNANTLRIKFENTLTVPPITITITYVLLEDGKTLKTEYEAPGRHYLGTLRRVE